ncbi:EH domain-containing protein 1-like [Miscanthus floridulus]|uniref:EH domain-containing protein 1-like n=1 Tax=Miscanthus floridulus TaxID=154761 RepID=UPI00345792B9
MKRPQDWVKPKPSELGDCTTIMLRNIPNKLRSGDMISLLDEQCARANRAAGSIVAAYDVLYLPMDFSKYDGNCFQKSKHLVKRVDPEMDGYPQEQSHLTNKWFSSKSSKKIPLTVVTSVIDGLKKLYIEKLKPLEVTYKFNDFVSPLLVEMECKVKQFTIG